jgi:hypothetical protein
MNSDSQQLRHNPNLNSHTFLILEQDKQWFDIQKIDTTSIGDFNAPTTLALHKFYTHAQSALNVNRQDMLKAIIGKSTLLVEEIQQELKSKNYK